MSAGMHDPVATRRAIEALRSGVPNRDAVRALGCTQPRIEELFKQRLNTATDLAAPPAASILVTGNFGSGKSHLLEYLKDFSLGEGFVCSKVAVSKETPLHNLERFYRSAIEAAVVPDKTGSALTEIATTLNFDSPGYAKFFRWLNRDDNTLNLRFAAMVFLYENLAQDVGARDRIVQDWSGDAMSLTEIRRYLREVGESATYPLVRATKKELAPQRFQFAARLIRAAGYAGWVLLVDETELVGRYSVKQRAKAYGEMARLSGRIEAERIPGLFSVFALTTDFADVILEGRNDLEKVPGRLRASAVEADQQLADAAELGMKMILRDAVPLHPPDWEMLQDTLAKIRDLYTRAYGWRAPAAGDIEQLTSRRMREFIRRWISEWDLKRLYPGYEPVITADEVVQDLSEDAAWSGPDEAAAAAGG